MPRKRQRGIPKRHTGRPIKHGAYALVFRDEIVAQHPELVRYCRDCYDDLIHKIAPEGPETLPRGKRILLDRLLSKLQVAGLLDIYLGKGGIIRRDQLDKRILETEPAVSVWLSVNAAILRDLQVLGLEPVKLKPKQLSPAELMAEVVEDERRETEARAAKEAAQDRAQDAPEGQTENDEDRELNDPAKLSTSEI